MPVSINGLGSYATIQEAVTAANAGDLITVGAGTYNENVTVNKQLTIEGANVGVAGDSGGRGAESTINGYIYVNVAGVTLDGLEVTGGNLFGTNYGVYVDRDNATIANSLITGNNIVGSSGVATPYGGDISGLSLTDNAFADWYWATYLNPTTTFSATGNNFDDTGLVGDGFGGGSVISGNTFDGPGAGVGVGVFATVQDIGAIVDGTNVYSNTANNGIYLYGDGDAGGQTVTGTQFDDYITDAYKSVPGSGDDDTVNGGDGDDYLDMGAGEDTLNGGNGDDTLVGGAGADQLNGGDDNDTYYADSSDTITEAASNGTDTVISTGSIVLSDNVENLTLVDGDSNTQTFDDMALGPITDGENGWSMAGTDDQEVVDLGNGNHAFRMSSDPSSPDFGGPFSPDLSVTAGEPLTTADHAGQSIHYRFKPVNPTPDGSRLEIDFGTANGTDRNNFMVIESFGSTGIRIAVGEPTPPSGEFTGSEDPPPADWRELVTGVDPTVWHDVELRLTYVDGVNNDVIDVYLDGQHIGTTTTFENYRDYSANIAAGHDANAENNQTSSVFFRGGANGGPNDGPGGQNQGFLIDDITNAIYSHANGTGNGLANVITGNSGDNELSGLGGDDTLIGNAGADQLVGGDDDDTYYADASDTIVEAAAGGTDTVISSDSITLSANVENLTLVDGASFREDFEDLALGPIADGEGGWQSAGGPKDQNVVVDPDDSANQVYQVSSDPHSGDFAGPYSPHLGATAGESTTSADFDSMQATFTFKAVSSSPDDSTLEVDLATAGGDRNNFLRIENTGTGIRIAVNEPTTDQDGWTTDDFSAFSGNREMISGVDATVSHQLTMVVNYIDGPNNDVVKIYLDGNFIGQTTTFENYRDFSANIGSTHEQNAENNQTDRILIRPSAALGNTEEGPQDGPGDQNQGFQFDKITYSAFDKAGPSGTGNAEANVITGNSGDNELSGLGNNDTLNGGFGDDTLIGGAGEDTFNGGAGIDTAVVGDGGGSFDPSDYDFSGLTVTGGVVAGTLESPDGTETLDGIEFIKVANTGSDTFVVLEGMSIQAAIDAASDGDKIYVIGTHREQIEVDGRANLTIFGDGDSTVIEMPDDPQATNDLTGAARARSAVVSIENSSNIVFEDIKVDGRGRGDAISGTDADINGVYIGNSSATVHDVTVIGARDPLQVDGTPAGSQHGQAIVVVNDDAAARMVSLTDNDISDFQKNGIRVEGSGLTAVITGNTINGAGFLPSNGAIAQNGIVVLNGAGGIIDHNEVSEIGYQRGVAVTADILALGAADGLQVTNNTLHGATDDTSAHVATTNFGIYVSGETDNVVITGNAIDHMVFGIDLDSNTDNPTLSGNTFSDMFASVTTNDPAPETWTGDNYEIYGGDNDAALTLTLSSGVDYVEGTTYDDNLTGAEGDDILDGAAGTDTAHYAGPATIATSGGGWSVTDAGGTDTLTNFEIVDDSASGKTLLVGNGGYATIQAAIDAAVDGDTIRIAAGTYNEFVNVNKDGLTLIADEDAVLQGTLRSTNSIPNGTTLADWLKTAAGYTGTGDGVTVSADNVTISGLKISGFTNGAVLANGVDHVKFDGVDFAGNIIGLHKADTSGVTDLDIIGGSFSDGFLGINFAKTVVSGQSASGNISDVLIDGTDFEHLLRKGIYAETLSSATLDHITMTDVGQFGGMPSSGPTGAGGNGINLNLKNGAYSNITIQNFTLTDVGASDKGVAANDSHVNGGAIVIEARSTGTYASVPATVTDAVVVQNGTITGHTSTAVHVGEPTQADSGPNVTVTNVSLNGIDVEHNALHGEIANEGQGTLTVNGTAGVDNLVASTNSDGAFDISGGAGADNLAGGSANDTFDGGTEGDTINGRGGVDTATGYGSDYHLAYDTINHHWQVTNNTTTDTLIDIERVVINGQTFLLVDKDADGGYSTVQQAVDAIHAAGVDGTTIMVGPGTFSEDIDVDNFNVDFAIKSLNAGVDPDLWDSDLTATINRISAGGSSLLIDGLNVVGTTTTTVGGPSYSAILFGGDPDDTLTVKNSVLTVDAHDDQGFGLNISLGTGAILIDHVDVTTFANPDANTSQYGAWINGQDSGDATRSVTITNSSFEIGAPRSFSLAFDGYPGTLDVSGNTFGPTGPNADSAVRVLDTSNVLTGQADFTGIAGNTFADPIGSTGQLANDTTVFDGVVEGVTVIFGSNTYAGSVVLSSVVDASESSVAETLAGTAGDDLITGSAFGDTITGSGGNDHIYAGDGTDAVKFSGNWLDYTVTNTAADTYTVRDDRASSPDGTDTVVGAENLQFADYTMSVAAAVNDAPVGADDTNSADAVLEDGSGPDLTASGGVLGNDTDPDAGFGDTKAVTGARAGLESAGGSLTAIDADGETIQGAYGSLLIHADGTYTYTLDNGLAQSLPASGGTDTFTYVVADHKGLTDTAQLVISIGGSNDEPTVTAVSGTPVNLTETADNSNPNFEPVSGTLTVNDVDVGNTVTGVILSTVVTTNGNPGAPGTVANDLTHATGGGSALTFGSVVPNGTASALSWTYDPGNASLNILSEEDVVTITYTVAVTDSLTNSTTTQQIIVNVTGTNEIYTSQQTPDDDSINGGSSADDIQGLGGDDTISGAGGNDDLDGNDGDDTILGGGGDDTITGGDGDDSLDGGSNNDTISGGSGDDTINGGSGDDTLSGGPGEDTIIGGSGTDTLVLDKPWTSYNIVKAGTIYTIEDRDTGEIDTVTTVEQFKFNGGTGPNSGPFAAALILNDAPVAGNDTASSGNVLGNDTDVDSALGDTKTVTGARIGAESTGASFTSVGTGTTVEGTYGTLTINDDGSYSYNAGGAAYDGLGSSDHVTDTFTYEVADAHGLTDTAEISIAVTGGNEPPTGSPTATLPAGTEDVTYTVNESVLLQGFTDPDSGDTLHVTNVSASNGTAVLNAGVVTVTPAPDYFGAVTLTYEVTDGNGGTLTGQTRTYTLAAVDDAPVAADGTASTPEDTAVVIDVASMITEVDGDGVTVTATATHGSVTVSGTEITFNPDADYAGNAASITYTVTDNTGAHLSDTGTIAVTIAPTDDDPPVAADGTATTAEDTAVVVDVASLITDPDNDGYTVSATATHGSVTVSGAEITFTPDDDYTGNTASITYTVTDSTGAALSDTGTIAVTVTPVDDAPVAANSSASTAEDTAVVIDVASLITEVDGDAYIVNATTTHGTAMVSGTEITFTPDDDYNGFADISYTVTDSTGAALSDTGTIGVTVTPVDDAPDAANGTASTAEDTSVVIDVASLITEVDGDDYTVDATAANGTVTINGTEITFTPDANFNNGPAGITYSVTDNTGAALSDTGNVAITVTPVNDPATITGTSTGTVTEDGTETAGGDLDVSDVDSGEAQFQTPGSLAGTYGAFTFDALTGAWTYQLNSADPDLNTVDAGEDVSDTLLVTSLDGTDTRTISVLIHGADEPVTGIFGTPGNDAPPAFIGTAAGENMFGLAGDDVLRGLGGADHLDGGDDNDTADYAGSAAVNVSLVDGSVGVGGDAAGDTFAFIENLTGSSFADTLTGNDGNNILDGGAGIDTMIGGDGNDTYVVDVAGDIVTETVGQGTDTINTGLTTYSLAVLPDVENLVYTGISNFIGTGNAAVNDITGSSGNDKLDGGAGIDYLHGGGGNDTYIVDDTNDVVDESLTNGTDTVIASVTYTLSANVENLTLTGGGDINGTGNADANIIKGNIGNNRLDGGLGADNMQGDLGNDTYVIDNTGDIAVEKAGGGDHDTVETTLNAYTLKTFVEDLTFIGTGNFVGKGNTDNNIITGGAGDDNLDGNTGADTMIGLGGNDTYLVDNINDVITEAIGGGNDIVNVQTADYTVGANVEEIRLGNIGRNIVANAENNVIVGNGQINRLDGGAGADTMTGLSGNDVFIFNKGQANGDVVTDFAGAGAAAGDQLEFHGYGLASTITRSGDFYTIHDSNGGPDETFRLTGVTTLDTATGGSHNDVIFIA